MSQQATLFDLWWDGWRTAVKVEETLLAANEVMARRLPTIAHAMRDPLDADNVELARMVGEKPVAFAQAGSSLASDVIAVQVELAEAALRLGTLFATDAMPTRVQILAIQNGVGRAARIAVNSPGRSLDPIHSRAANTRRLRRRKVRDT